jgi:hypothetical protein
MPRGKPTPFLIRNPLIQREDPDLRKPIRAEQIVPVPKCNPRPTSMLDRIIRRVEEISLTPKYNTRKRLNQAKRSVFYTELPAVSIGEYIKRIDYYTGQRGIPKSVFVAAAYYIDKYVNVLAPTPSKIHKIVLITVGIAMKFLEDQPIYNSDYTPIMGVPWKEINKIEFKFLKWIHWRCAVSSEEYLKFCGQLYGFGPALAQPV